MLGVRYKSQWGGVNGINAFTTQSFVYEESMPCSPFDIGLQILQDQEGAGRLQTLTAGLKLAGSFPMGPIVFRPGINIQFGQKSVDFSRLTFADQLDSKYGFEDAFGNPNLTTSPLAGGTAMSQLYFAPAIGGIVQYLSTPRQRSVQPIYVVVGGAIHNAVNLGNRGLFGNEDSLLDVGSILSRRTTLHASAEFYTKLGGGQYVAIRPRVLYQRQRNLQYLEAGARAGLNSSLAIGAYYHSTARQADEGVNTNWLSLQLEWNNFLAAPNNQLNRLDFSFSYSAGISGLKNNVGALFEFGMTYHFSTSPLCSLNPSVNASHLKRRNNTSVCPGSGRNKLYENIWYRN